MKKRILELKCLPILKIVIAQNLFWRNCGIRYHWNQRTDLALNIL